MGLRLAMIGGGWEGGFSKENFGVLKRGRDKEKWCRYKPQNFTRKYFSVQGMKAKYLIWQATFT
jgi:hypothetical protein